MLRTTLKQQRHHQSTRHTRRVQHGGAAWASIAPERLEKWTAALADTGLEFVLNDAWKAGEKAAELYVKLVAEQDTLFDAAVKCMYAEFGIADPTEAAIIAAVTTPGDKSAIFAYLDDAEMLLSFKKSGVSSREAKTKIQQIKAEGLLALLLNPARVRNTFIHDLAAICVAQKADPTILTQVTDEALKNLRINRYEVLTEGNALTQTGAQLRDGYFVMQKISTFRADLGVDATTGKADRFWSTFLTNCANSNTATVTGFLQKYSNIEGTTLRAIVGDQGGLPYAALAAFIYNIYATMGGDLTTNVLTTISTATKSDTLGIAKAANTGIYTLSASTARIDAEFPDASELNKDVVAGLTLGQVLSNINLRQLQFIAHLCKAIELNEAAVAAATGAAAAGSSSSSRI
jgi:hypothetical protein